MNGGDGEAVSLLLQGDVRTGLHMLGGEMRLAEDQRERHGEAAGVGGADQLFGVGAGFVFEPAGKAVRVGIQRAAFGVDLALAEINKKNKDRGSVCRNVAVSSDGS